MFKPIIKALAPGLVATFFIQTCFAQSGTADTLMRTAVANTISYFNKAIGEQSRLYNGPEYSFYSPVIRNNAYFRDLNSFSKGSVQFDGFTYNNVPLMYDIYKDLLVAQLYNNFSNYVLASDRVGSFDLAGQHFIYMPGKQASALGIAAGYYDLLYNGKVQALAKYAKSIQNATGVNGIETYFTDTKKEFYIKKGNTCRAVSSEGNILNVFKDRKKELQQYIKNNYIQYKKDPEQAITAITAFYDHLNQ